MTINGHVFQSGETYNTIADNIQMRVVAGKQGDNSCAGFATVRVRGLSQCTAFSGSVKPRYAIFRDRLSDR